MKLRKESVKTLFLVLLLQAAMCSSNMAVPKSTKIVDVLKDRGEQDVSFNSTKGSTKKIPNDPSLPEDIPRLTASSAERTTTVNKKETSACNISAKALAQIVKPTASLWLVDDNTMELLYNDLQLLIDCTRPRDQLVFITKRAIKLARTVEIVHKLDFIGTKTRVHKAERSGDEVTSFTCPESGPAFSISGTTFLAKTLRIANCTRSSRNAVLVFGENSNSKLYRLSIRNNANRAILVGSQARLLVIEADFEENEFNNDGGAIYVGSYSYISILNSNFRGNAATNGGNGGALYFDQYNIVFIKGCTFANNSCDDDGGAIHLNAHNEISIQKSKFTNNNAKDCGGAIILMKNCTLNVLLSVFANNNCGRLAGVIHFEYEIGASIQESTFSNNTSNDEGGAIWIFEYNRLSIKASLFTNNTAKSYGGAIRLYYKSVLSVTASTFANNTSGSYGGAVFADLMCMLTIQRSTISNNTATESAGGIHLGTNNTLTTFSSTISNNTAPNGGAMMLDRTNTLHIQGCTLNDNTAKNYGGALYLFINNMAAILDSSLSKNRAGHASAPYGEAIHSNGDSNLLFLLNAHITNDEKGKTTTTYPGLTKDAPRIVSNKGITF